MNNLSIIPKIGGKFRQAQSIVSLFPLGDNKMPYLDLFCGGLSVFFQKHPSPVEVLNDLDQDTMNLWEIIQKDGKKLAEEANKLPYSRVLYEKWAKERHECEEPTDSFERALRFFYLCRCSVSGKSVYPRRIKSGWGHSIESNKARHYYSAVGKIVIAEDRLRNVQLECLDFRSAMESYDAEGIVIYADPPFVGVEEYYHHRFTEADHRDLAALLNGSRAHIVLSYYEHPLVRELYPEGKWHYHSTARQVSSSGATGVNREGHEQPSTSEWIITNYESEGPTLFSKEGGGVK